MVSRPARDNGPDAEVFEQGRFERPLLAVGGEHGTPYTLSQFEGRVSSLTGGVIAGCGHMVPEEAPEALAAHLLKFWKEKG